MIVADEPHVVAVVPGLLGTADGAQRPAVSERFLVGLELTLRARVPQTSVRVVPLPMLPAEALVTRQRLLSAQLATLARRFGEPRVHLLGLGTGGVDAALIARQHALVEAGEGTSRYDEIALDHRAIDSVTTLAAPLFGTSLVRASMPAVGPGTGTSAVRAVSPASWSLAASVPDGTPVPPSLRAVDDRRLALAGAVLRRGPLHRDLDPDVVGALVARDNRRPGVAMFCFATLAPLPGTGLEGTPADTLYADLWRWTAERATGAAAPRFPSFDASDVIASHADLRPALILPEDSDGLINTARQVDPQATFAGLVLGDHADVLGLYRRTDPFSGATFDPGLLASGAAFGDAEFFVLLERIADGIANTIVKRPWGGGD